MSEKYHKNRRDFFQLNTFKKPTHIYNAGVLPFQIESNQVFLCMGKDKDGYWSDFGGKAEPVDKYNVLETAAREFYEESYGVILNFDQIRHQLNNEENFIQINSESYKNIRYYMFIVQVPKINGTEQHFKQISNYLHYINAGYQYKEKIEIGWISLNTLINIIEHKDHEASKKWPLKKVFQRTLINNLNTLKKLKHKEEIYL